MIGFVVGALVWFGIVTSIINREPGTVDAGVGFWLLASGVALVGGLLLSIIIPTTIAGISIASSLGAVVGIIVSLVTGQPGMLVPMLVALVASAVVAVGSQAIMSARG